MKRLTVLIIAVVITNLTLGFAQDKFTGHWSGKLFFGTRALQIVLNISKDGDTLKATIDSPDQGAMGIKVQSVTLSNDSIFLDIKSIGGSYAAKYVDAKDSVYLSGEFKQAGMKLPLNLVRSDKSVVLSRPQEPKPPFPYITEEVEFENKSAGVRFSGTFSRPDKEGKYAAVVLVTGSGKQDRDESLFGHKPFAVIADYLTRNGFAVLRYDERGVGKSTGDFSRATTMDFTLDALEAVRFLKSRPDVIVDKVGIIGHSEGGVVAPLAASISTDVNFIIMLAGLGVPGDELLAMQYRALMKAEGMTDEKIERQLLFNRELFDIATSEDDSVRYFDKANELITEFRKILSDTEKEEPVFSETSLKQLVTIANTPWFRYFIKTDPKKFLSKVTVPVLALNGTKDLQVPYEENLGGIEKALKAAGNKNFKIVKLYGLNHLFQKAEKGTMEEYGQIEETINPAALEAIKGWMMGVIKN